MISSWILLIVGIAAVISLLAYGFCERTHIYGKNNESAALNVLIIACLLCLSFAGGLTVNVLGHQQLKANEARRRTNVIESVEEMIIRADRVKNGQSDTNLHGLNDISRSNTYKKAIAQPHP